MVNLMILVFRHLRRKEKENHPTLQTKLVERILHRPQGQPRFEIVRPPEANHFVLEVVISKSFKQSNAAREITYRARLRDPVADVPLNFLLPHLHALFDTCITRSPEGIMVNQG